MDFIQKQKSALITLAVLIAVSVAVYYWRTGETYPGSYNVKVGNYRLEDGLHDQALEEFNKALQKKPDNIHAYLGIAVTYLQTGRLSEAETTFDKIFSINPEFAVGYANRGVLYDRTGRYPQALADYQKALELDPFLSKGPSWLWRFMRNIDEKPPTISDRADYLEKELQKPENERVLKVQEVDQQQRMYKAK